MGKIVSALLLTMSLLSVASLADSVFALKGFVVTAIAYYRSLVSPVLALANWLLPVSIPPTLFDLFVVAILINTATAKSVNAELLLEGVNAPVWIRIAHHSVFLIVWLAVAIGLYLFDTRLGLVLAALSFPLFWLLRGYIMVALFRRPETFVERVDRRTALYILTVYLIVAVLAAISSGLARPMN